MSSFKNRIIRAAKLDVHLNQENSVSPLACDSIEAEHCSHISSVNPHFFSLRKSV